MAVNKVTYAGRTLIDLTDATATAAQILEGFTAYGRDGVRRTGTASTLRHSAASVTLPASSWKDGTQTVSVPAVTNSGWVVVQAADSCGEDYEALGVTCTAQAPGKLTFACDLTPEQDLTADIHVFA